MNIFKFEDATVNNEYFFVFENDVYSSVDLHSHNYIEIAYVKSGRAWHFIGGEKKPIKKGDFFFVDFGVEHSYSVYNNEPVTIINILFKPVFIDKSLFRCRQFREILENQLFTLDYSSIPHTFFDDNDEIQAIVCLMLKEYENKRIGHIQILRAYLIEIIILALRKHEDLHNAPKNNYVDFTIDVIKNKYFENLKLSDIAFELNISCAYLSRLFKQQTKLSFSRYIQWYRLKTAFRLLVNSSHKIVDIAKIVGYSDYKFFLKIFKSEFSCTPKQIRKLQQVNDNAYLEI